jgi:hypothetical protein
VQQAAAGTGDGIGIGVDAQELLLGSSRSAADASTTMPPQQHTLKVATRKRLKGDAGDGDAGTVKKMREKRPEASARGAGVDPHADDIETLTADCVDVDVVLSALREAM